MDSTIGTCSQCGGPVRVPSVWAGINPPRPMCAQCGAIASPAFGPIIETVPRPKPNVFPLGPYTKENTNDG